MAEVMRSRLPSSVTTAATASPGSAVERQFYDLNRVEDIEGDCVVQRKYTDHPDLLFRNAVMQRSKGEYNGFLLKDQLAVEQAVNHGATPLEDADLDVTL